ncbi:MAG: WD40 repeat domain-containing protein [Aureliella sp.]
MKSLIHYFLAFSQMLLVCSLASSVSCWAEEKDDVPNGPWISSVVWQGDSELIGTRSQGLLFRPADVVRAASTAPQELTVIGQAEMSLWSVCAVGDGRVAASDYKGGVWLFESPTTQAAEQSTAGKPFELDARWIRAMENSPVAGELLAGTEDGKLLVLSVDETKETRRVDAHQAAIFDIAFNSAGDKVATCAGDGTIKLFSWPQLETLASMSVGKEAIWSVLFVNEDKNLISGGGDNAIQLWDVASAKSIVSVAVAGNWVTSLEALPESTLVVAGCMDGKLLVADWSTMQAVHSQAGPGSAIWSIALSPSGQKLAVATRKHGLAVVDTQAWLAAGQSAAEAARAVRPPAPK